MECLHHFQEIVDYCQRNPSAAGVVSKELVLCQEMVTLLPIKIQKMKMELQE